MAASPGASSMKTNTMTVMPSRVGIIDTTRLTR